MPRELLRQQLGCNRSGRRNTLPGHLCLGPKRELLVRLVRQQPKHSATGTGDAATFETAYQLKDSNGNKIPLTYKWVRITLKADNMTPVTVGTGNGSQVCWDGSHEQQLPTAGYHTDCTPISGGITNIAVTASGSGYTSAPTVTISGGSGSGATATAVVGQLPVGITSVTLSNRRGGLYERAGRDHYPRRRARQRGHGERGAERYPARQFRDPQWS